MDTGIRVFNQHNLSSAGDRTEHLKQIQSCKLTSDSGNRLKIDSVEVYLTYSGRRRDYYNRHR